MKRVFVICLILLLAFQAAWQMSQVSAAEQTQEQPLRVVTKPLEPFVFEQDGQLMGFSIELWEAIATDLGLAYEWVEVETVADQLDAIANGEADVAIAGISMTPEREERIDFSHPYFDSGLLIITPTEGSGGVGSLLKSLFSPTLLKILGLGLLTLLFMAHVVWLLERDNGQGMPRQYIPGIWDAMWWSLATIANYQYGDGQKPQSFARRIIAMGWIVLSIILIAQFTASITASLTVERLSGNIQGPQDLPGKRIATVSGTTSARYLESEGLSYVGVSKIDEAYALLGQEEVQAVVYDAPVLMYYALQQGRGKIDIAGSIFEDDTYGIALPTDSALREPINNSLLRLRQNGTYDAIYAKWFQSEG